MENCIQEFISGSFDKSCIQLIISKLLGYSIICLSAILKVPQIKNMLNTKTDKGLNYVSVYSEILLYLFATLYSFHYRNPISTYGENIIVLIQCLIILNLSYKYATKKVSMFEKINAAGFIILFPVLMIVNEASIPDKYWELLASSSLIIISVARWSQIIHSYRHKDTGPLSSFSFVLALCGNLARAFTTISETGDKILLLSYLYGAVLSLICLIQIFIYSKPKEKKD
jgi:mannose-P-dolichol utilization defect protein 1